MLTARAIVRDGLNGGASYDVLKDGVAVGRVDVFGERLGRRLYDVYDLDGNKVHEGEVLPGWPAGGDRVAIEAWRLRSSPNLV